MSFAKEIETSIAFYNHAKGDDAKKQLPQTDLRSIATTTEQRQLDALNTAVNHLKL